MIYSIRCARGEFFEIISDIWMSNSPERYYLAILAKKTSQNSFPARGKLEAISSGHLAELLTARMGILLVLVNSEKTAEKKVGFARAVFSSLSSIPLPR